MKLTNAVALVSILLAACSSQLDGSNDGDGAGVDAGPVFPADASGPAANQCGDSAELVYVVDRDYRLLSFDPRKLNTAESPFTLIGALSCPAGSAWPNWPGGNPATPFSMSVDRQGTAMVLYTSGEIFRVSTTNASCSSSGFQKGQSGFELFGMGYVSDSAGSSSETLFIAGGPVSQSNQSGDLARIDGSLSVFPLSDLPGAEYNPEMTGTGNGELYAYFPGISNSYVARLNKATSVPEQSWPLAPLGAQVAAWAFAHWGGKFYIFISVNTQNGLSSQVKVLDPTTGIESVAIANSPYAIVGAGVSTCAPTDVVE